MPEPVNQPTDGYLKNQAPYPSDGPGFVGRDQSKYIWKAIKTHLKPRLTKSRKGLVRNSDVHIKHKKVKFY